MMYLIKITISEYVICPAINTPQINSSLGRNRCAVTQTSVPASPLSVKQPPRVVDCRNTNQRWEGESKSIALGQLPKIEYPVWPHHSWKIKTVSTFILPKPTGLRSGALGENNLPWRVPFWEMQPCGLEMLAGKKLNFCSSDRLRLFEGNAHTSQPQWRCPEVELQLAPSPNTVKI